MTVTEDNRIEPRVIRPGPRELGLRIVRRGLEPTDRIVINGLMRVRPGMQVTPQPGRIELPRRRSRRATAEGRWSGGMGFAHFFVDRPIFASVLLDPDRPDRRVPPISRLPVAQYPGDRAADHPGQRQLSRAPRPRS